MKKRIKNYFIQKFNPVLYKERNELNYWNWRKSLEGSLSNNHYEAYYTRHFGIDEDFYRDKVLLDIGCGPRGSLEWARMAKRAIGLDPLANEYLKLGANPHRMEYINAPSENIPLPDESCDAVFSFNSLDHVFSVEQSLNEIKRVLKPNGFLLLIVEVNHLPKPCEPHKISPKQLVDFLEPDLKNQILDLYDPSIVKGAYQSIEAGKKLNEPYNSTEIGWLSAKFIKK